MRKGHDVKLSLFEAQKGKIQEIFFFFLLPWSDYQSDRYIFQVPARVESVSAAAGPLPLCPSPSISLSLPLCKWVSQQLNKYLQTRTLNVFAPRRANSAASGGFVRICIKQIFAAALARWFKEFEGATGLSWGSCSPSNTSWSEKTRFSSSFLWASEAAVPIKQSSRKSECKTDCNQTQCEQCRD